MDIDPKELVDNAQSARDLEDISEKRLNAAVAVTIAVLATFMAICKVKDDNIVQAMQQAQADKLDHWAYYQARNIRQQVAEATATQLELARGSANAATASSYDTAIAKYHALGEEQAKKKDELRQQAEADQKKYDDLNFRDDQFDLCDALMAIAIAMLAVTALTGLWPLFWASLVPTVCGTLMGIAGLAGLSWHPDWLVRLLS
jgi:hypothetical protein